MSCIEAAAITIRFFLGLLLLQVAAAAGGAAAEGGKTMRPPEKHSCFSPAEV